MTSGPETEWVYSYNPRAHMGLPRGRNKTETDVLFSEPTYEDNSSPNILKTYIIRLQSDRIMFLQYVLVFSSLQ